MQEPTMAERLELRWIPVLDARGQERLESHWVPVGDPHATGRHAA